MRWLFHVRHVGTAAGDRYAPESLAREGFIHASYVKDVVESARLYFPADARLEVLQIDPRRLDVPVDVAQTPRGAMPHLHGPVPTDAIRATVPLEDFEAKGFGDEVTGTRFGFIAFDGMTLLDLVGVYDPLSRIASMGFDATSTCEVVAGHEGQVWARDGVELKVQRVRPPLTDFDVVVVPGGPGSRTLVREASFIDWLAAFPVNRLIASVCTGALLLGGAGRLRGKRATTHANALGDLAAYGATAVAERVVDEGQLVTAGGVTSGLDLGIHLVRRLHGDEVAAKVERQMEWGDGRSAR